MGSPRALELEAHGGKLGSREHVLVATLTDAAGRVRVCVNAFADIERRLKFPDAWLPVKVESGDLVITTDKFARSIQLEGNVNGDPFGWFFEDHYFDLLPGEIQVVRILGTHPDGRATARAWYSPHETQVDWKRR